MLPIARRLPHNVDAEMALLGAIIIDNRVFDRACQNLAADHFSVAENSVLFEACSQLIQTGRTADPVTLKSWVAGNDAFNAVDGVAYLHLLCECATTTTLASSYADTIRDLAILRQLIAIGEDIVARAYDPQATETASDQVEQAEVDLSALAGGKIDEAWKHISAAALDALKSAEAAHKGELEPAISTGLADVDRIITGLMPGKLYVIGSRPAMGKAQPLDAKVLRADGTWARMGDLKFGDEVASIDGAASGVIGIYPQGKKEIFDVTFSDGRVAQCCAEHLWRVMYRDWPSKRVVDTETLRQMLMRKRYKNRLSVDMVSGHFGRGSLPLDPYVLGVLLGDGDLTGSTIRLTSADEEILSEVQSRLGGEVELRHRCGDKYTYNLVSRGVSGRKIEDGCKLARPRRFNGALRSTWPKTVYPVKRALRSLGLHGQGSADKFIPQIYLSASREDRMDLLRGLMDTDGWSEKHAAVRFSSCSMALAEGVQALVRSLGGACSIVCKKTVCVVDGQRRPGADAWLCKIRHENAEEFFRLKRKSYRAKRSHNLSVRLNLESITPRGVAETQCICVSHPSRLYVTDEYTVTHNTAIAINMAVAAARKGNPVGFFSMEMQAEEIGLREVARSSSLPAKNIAAGDVRTEDFASLIVNVRGMQSLPLWINDTPGLTVQQIRSMTRRAKAKHKFKIVVVDYLQLCRTAGKRDWTTVGEISTGLKLLAREENIAVIALCQLNRDVEKRDNKRPTMADLRETGNIEQDADVIMFLTRPEVYMRRTEPPIHDPEYVEWKRELERVAGLAELVIDKHRGGETGLVRLHFDAEKTSFGNLSQEAL